MDMKTRCQFCHGVRQVGARFGWDFVDPSPTFQQKTAKNLYYHVKYPQADALERGLQMPFQASITAEEANNLWAWLKSVATKKLNAYGL